MRYEQRQREREQLKDLDADILRAGMVLLSLLVDRRRLDPVFTIDFINGIVGTLQQICPGQSKGEI